MRYNAKMRILTVIPIAKGTPKDTLTYFTKSDVPIGCIVSIPIRKKTGFGLVIKSIEATEIKSELKNLSYSIRKIEKIKSHKFLCTSFIESTQDIADYTAGSVGAVLSALIPNSILENSDKLSFISRPKLPDAFHDTVLLQTDDDERFATYKSLIREEFARGRSVFFCMPTTEDVKNAYGSLEKGIEKYTYTLHSGMSKKEVTGVWKKIIEEKHMVLIVATGSFLSIPREDIGAIILEKESSRAYKMQTRPFLDIRTAVEIIAKRSKCRLILGDTFLRTETLWEEKNGKYAELLPLKFRSLSTAMSEIISMREKKNILVRAEKKEFAVFSEELFSLLEKTKQNNEHIFLFCGRKGLSPSTVCRDCSTIVTCKNCNAPVVLYNKKEAGKNLFVCHHCGERREAEELCHYCKSWRLLPLGIGIEKVEEEAKKIFGENNIFIMDKDHITTHKQAVKVRDNFYNSPASVCIGTEMALTYLNQKIENTAVVSLDSFFSIPDFRINEKIFHIILALRARTLQKLIIQTRQENSSPGYKIFDYALHGNLIDFYREEVAERKEIGYPPFVTYIKITLVGEKNTVKKQMAETAEFLKPHILSIFEAFSSGGNQKYTVHGLLSLSKGEWPNYALLEKLRNLSPKFIIKVDPDTLL